MTDQSFDRRMTALETRMEYLDQHGSRGLDSLREQVGSLQRDMGKLEATTGRIEADVQSMSLTLVTLKPSRQWPAIVAYLGLLLPMYALVIDLMATRR